MDIVKRLIYIGLLHALCACASGSSTSATNPDESVNRLKSLPAQTTPQTTRQKTPQAASTIKDPPQEPFSKVLKPGEFTWNPERATTGPVVMIVSIPDQLAYVYRNGILIGRTTVSSGRPGHNSPTGVFHILEKQVKHFSSKYNNAPMPNMERLTWDGIALHAGNLPGYPASHGCIRLPLEFSRLLYTVTSKGTTMVIADRSSAPEETVRPGLLLPQGVSGGGEAELDAELENSRFVWKPERAMDGPVSILMSAADKKIYVYRNGVLIGEAKLRIINPETPLPPGAYVMLDGYANEKSVYVPDKPARRWMAVGLPTKDGEMSVRQIEGRVRIPLRFARPLYDILQPGDVVMVTDLPATKQTTAHNRNFTIIAGQDQAEGKTTPR
jgi:lipoprotein-anchoring transpeptidase ErfK/SrfK